MITASGGMSWGTDGDVVTSSARVAKVRVSDYMLVTDGLECHATTAEFVITIDVRSSSSMSLFATPSFDITFMALILPYGAACCNSIMAIA